MKTVKMKRTGLIKSVSDRNAKALVYIKVAEYYEQETKKVEQVPEPVYYEVSVSDQAKKLAEGVQGAGYKLWLPHQTNQVFVIMPNDQIAELEKDFFFYTWCPYDETRSVIRLVISWGSTEEDVKAFLQAI